MLLSQSIKQYSFPLIKKQSHSEVVLKRSCLICFTEAGIAHEKKEEILYGARGHAPWEICVIWGILEANLSNPDTKIHDECFVPSICIHRSIILIFIEKSMLVYFVPTEDIFSSDFRFSFPWESSFLALFQHHIKFHADQLRSDSHARSRPLETVKMVNYSCSHRRHERIWLKSFSKMFDIKVFTMQDGHPDEHYWLHRSVCCSYG